MSYDLICDAHPNGLQDCYSTQEPYRHPPEDLTDAQAHVLLLVVVVLLLALAVRYCRD